LSIIQRTILCTLDGHSGHTAVRKQYGTTRAPYSKSRKEKIRENNTTIGGIIGTVGGPVGFFVCATIGAIIGNETSPRV
jgi:hypothetical protein